MLFSHNIFETADEYYCNPTTSRVLFTIYAVPQPDYIYSVYLNVYSNKVTNTVDFYLINLDTDTEELVFTSQQIADTQPHLVPSLQSYVSFAKQYLENYIEQFNISYQACDGDNFVNYDIEYRKSMCNTGVSYSIVEDSTNNEFRYYRNNMLIKLYFDIYNHRPTAMVEICEHNGLQWYELLTAPLENMRFDDCDDVYKFLETFLLNYTNNLS